MSPAEQLIVLKRCEELTKKGQKLVITWNGGDDSGFFEMQLDGKIIGNDYTNDDPVIDLVSNALGYRSFAGEFSTEGEVVYNRASKCFEGSDACSYTESTETACAIPIRISKYIWYDRVDIHIDTEDTVRVFVELIVLNGPRIPLHTTIENRLARSITTKIISLAKGIQNFNSINDDFQIRSSEFTAAGDKMQYLITQLSYTYDQHTDTAINIPLTQNDDLYATF